MHCGTARCIIYLPLTDFNGGKFRESYKMSSIFWVTKGSSVAPVHLATVCLVVVLVSPAGNNYMDCSVYIRTV